MSYSAEILRIKNVRPHSNADKVLLATCQGNQVVVGLDTKEGDLGIYFPTDGRLSHEFVYNNNLYRKAELNKNVDAPTGMFDDNRRVRTQKFRGEVSDGFWVPISSLSFIKGYDKLEEHISLTEFSGVPICEKYMTPLTRQAGSLGKSNKKSSKSSIMFKEHFDTDQLGKNLHKIPNDTKLIITEKVHGTSGRVGHVLLERNLSRFERVLSFFGVSIQKTYWGYLNGSRRVVLGESKSKDSKPFHDNTIRDYALSKFEGNLRKGETVYFEIVGFEPMGKPIMSGVNTKALKDKAFTEQYGEQMTFSYGCPNSTCRIYVYRITLTNEDGHTLDYNWEDVKKRCDEIGIAYVPELLQFTPPKLDQDSYILGTCEGLAKGPSTLDESHIKEGICLRVDSTNETYKYKSYEFKVLEGIIKDTAVVDMEEAS